MRMEAVVARAITAGRPGTEAVVTFKMLQVAVAVEARHI
jgi:hypothetical protein